MREKLTPPYTSPNQVQISKVIGYWCLYSIHFIKIPHANFVTAQILLVGGGFVLMWGWFGQMMGTVLGESTTEFEQVLAWIWKLFWS